MLICLLQLESSDVPKLRGVPKAPTLLSGFGQGHTRLSALHTPLGCCRIFQGMVQFSTRTKRAHPLLQLRCPSFLCLNPSGDLISALHHPQKATQLNLSEQYCLNPLQEFIYRWHKDLYTLQSSCPWELTSLSL